MSRLPPPAPGWRMVTCAECHLLLGWTRTQPPVVYCIPCFDAVAHLPEPGDDPEKK